MNLTKTFTSKSVRRFFFAVPIYLTLYSIFYDTSDEGALLIFSWVINISTLLICTLGISSTFIDTESFFRFKFACYSYVGIAILDTVVCYFYILNKNVLPDYPWWEILFLVLGLPLTSITRMVYFGIDFKTTFLVFRLLFNTLSIPLFLALVLLPLGNKEARTFRAKVFRKKRIHIKEKDDHQKIQEFSKMFESGAISEEEFKALKKKIIES